MAIKKVTKNPVKKVPAKKIAAEKPKKMVKKTGMRQTVCAEGKKMTKNGKCIKDKSYKICLTGYKLNAQGICVKDEDHKIIISSVPIAPPRPATKSKQFADLKESNEVFFKKAGPTVKLFGQTVQLKHI
jgi:hypothetical protein